MLIRCLRYCWLSFDVVVLWCWYQMNYLYAAYTTESYLRCKCRCKSKSCKMFMKFLRRKMLSPCILIYRWRLMPWSFCSTMTMELLLNYVGGLMPWSLFTLNYVEGLMPWIGTTCICISRWFTMSKSCIVDLSCIVESSC
jgi:hypothetical protein